MCVLYIMYGGLLFMILRLYNMLLDFSLKHVSLSRCYRVIQRSSCSNSSSIISKLKLTCSNKTGLSSSSSSSSRHSYACNNLAWHMQMRGPHSLEWLQLSNP